MTRENHEIWSLYFGLIQDMEVPVLNTKSHATYRIQHDFSMTRSKNILFVFTKMCTARDCNIPIDSLDLRIKKYNLHLLRKTFVRGQLFCRHADNCNDSLNTFTNKRNSTRVDYLQFMRKPLKDYSFWLHTVYWSISMLTLHISSS